MPSLQIKIEESTVHLIRSNTNQDVREIIIIWSELFEFYISLISILYYLSEDKLIGMKELVRKLPVPLHVNEDLIPRLHLANRVGELGVGSGGGAAGNVGDTFIRIMI